MVVAAHPRVQSTPIRLPNCEESLGSSATGLQADPHGVPQDQRTAAGLAADTLATRRAMCIGGGG